MRELAPDIFESISKPVVNASILAEFEFDSGPVRMWTSVGSLIWDGKEFLGGGNLIGVSDYTETQSLEAEGLNFSLNGIPPELISVALNEQYQGRLCRLWLGIVSTTSHLLQEDGESSILLEDGGRILLESEILGDPYLFFTGLMDVMEITDDGQSAQIKLAAENILTLLNRTKERRYTSEDQKSRFPNDKGLDFVAQLQDKKVAWGRSS